MLGQPKVLNLERATDGLRKLRFAPPLWGKGKRGELGVGCANARLAFTHSPSG